MSDSMVELGTAEQRIHAYLAERRLADEGVQVVALTGDASDRRYFRIRRPGMRSLVLALYGAPIDIASLPFATVAKLLAAMPVPVPAIEGHSNALGIVALEDLGDVTLQAHLGTEPSSRHVALYGEAVSLIADIQRRGRELATPGEGPYGIAFDIEKLTWELRFFAKHFLEAYKGAQIDDRARAALEEEWLAIAEELAHEPRVLCHRDYHSRNLMVHDGRLYIIDFQDARLGPDTYDLASLLRDSYVDITDTDRDRLIAAFRTMIGAPDAAAFRRRFDVMSLQRNLKALGTFGYQAAARQNSVYLQYVPRTLAYVRLNLDGARFARLRELLGRYLVELR